MPQLSRTTNLMSKNPNDSKFKGSNKKSFYRKDIFTVRTNINWNNPQDGAIGKSSWKEH